uniref:Uncharacterized protein n=1 Tax=Nelumbo nucifera TaxID=4432 RepID=A0A822Z042_NELNU|nr:TPA_asm: hypothetical protein HUJ06_007510 [Nelumbo nucifera]
MTLNTSYGGAAQLKNLAFGCGFNVSDPSVSGASLRPWTVFLSIVFILWS